MRWNIREVTTNPQWQFEDERSTSTFDEVGQVVLLHVFGGVVKADVVHLGGQKVPAVHRGSQQRVDAGRAGAWPQRAHTHTHTTSKWTQT